MGNNWIKIFERLEKEGGSLPVVSTENELKAFKDNKVWVDISNQLIYDLILARDDLENLGEGYDRNAISYLQGQCYAIRDLLAMPDTLMNSLKKEGEDPDEHEDD